MPIQKKTTEQLVKERPSPAQISTLPRLPVTVVVDNVRSLDNVGLLFRLCELARIERLYLTGYTGHPRRVGDSREEGLIARHEHRIFKTAVYAVPFQPWTYVEDPVPLVSYLKNEGSQIVALEQMQESVPYYKARYDLPLTLIVGHERVGIRQELLELADTHIEIPILGIGNSHNVAQATGIVLYHMLEETRQL
ncbi:MAG: TrmH family RNA methyltransferase [Candidatus Andersenbacteria bacterium]